MRISDWSSDVCSSDLPEAAAELQDGAAVPSPAGCPVGRGEGEVDPLAHGEAIDALQQQGEAEAAFQLDDDRWQTGRASGRERECQYVSIPMGAVSFKKKKHNARENRTNRIITS